MQSKMTVQINTDHNIHGREALRVHAKGVVEDSLNRFNQQITRVEVHLSDQNGESKGKPDKRCMMEARLENRQPVAVTHHATSLDQAIEGAARKLVHLLESRLGRLHGHHPR